MDPDVCRATMIELANIVLHTEEAGEQQRAAVALAEAVHDLDEWLRKGGYFPRVWAGSELNLRRFKEITGRDR